MKKNNFNLIELMVVTSIMGILSSMLLPALQNAREKGKSAVCVSQNKQMGILMRNMAEDKSGYASYAKQEIFPYYYYWFRFMERDYLESNVTNVYSSTSHDLFFCPSADETSDGSYTKLAYGYNYYLYYRNVTLNSIESPSSMVMIGDSGKGSITSVLLTSNSYPLGDRHGGKANIVFADGHVEKGTHSQLLNYTDKPYLYEF